MTPANVREFLDQLAVRLDPPPAPGERVRIAADPARSYEEILRGFFRHTLDTGGEAAFIRLWLLCLELSYADVTESIEEQYGRFFTGLGAGGEEPGASHG